MSKFKRRLRDRVTEMGRLAAWHDNHEMKAGETDARHATARRDLFGRRDRLTSQYGEVVERWFAAGYDAVIDFSLNTDWRKEPLF